ncbi:MAG: HAD family phosphatase [Actinobacteria bacterium]|nr:HAD family phosphatase [Actinomycetota bacterium]
MIDAVIFDLDGVLVDTEQVWDEVRETLVRERGGRWHDRAQADMMGMSSAEWSRYLHDELGLTEPPEELNRLVVERMQRRYRDGLPMFDGAAEAVRRLAERWPLGLASSSNRPLIDLALRKLGVAELFRVTVSSEEVERGKPAPDVYLEAALRLEVSPDRCAAVEDSANGIRSAKASGMLVIAIPNAHFPPDDEVLELADDRLESLAKLRPKAVAGSGSSRPGR